jgi:hypothetical protein
MDIAVGLKSFGALIAFPVRGEKWAEKMLIGSGLILLGFIVPIVPLIFVYGYAIRIMLQAIAGERLQLPAWRDWDKLASVGARALVIWLIFLVPAMLVLGVGFVLYMLSSLSMAAAQSGSAWPFGLYFFGLSAWMISLPVGSLLMLLAAVIIPPALSHFAVNDRFSAAFAFKEWWPVLAANKMGYLVAWVFVMGVFGLAYSAIMMLGYTFILCWLIPFLLAPLSYFVFVLGAGLFGECYRGGMIARYS